MPLLPAPTDINRLEELFAQSRFLEARILLTGFDPPEGWSDLRGRLIGGLHLASLGAKRRGARLFHITWRRNPADPAARYFYAVSFCERHGPLEAIRLVRGWLPAESPPAASESHSRHVVYLWLMLAHCLSQFRDFEAAETWLDAARRELPDDPWIHVETACVRHNADRYDDARSSLEHALTLRRDFRPAIEMLAAVLPLQGRQEDAIATLRRALTEDQMQSAAAAAQWANLLYENDRFDEALEAVELVEHFSPLAEKPLTDWLRTRRADILHRLGRDAEACEAARPVRTAYYDNLVRCLERPAPADAGRLILPVGFVRQHHMTCAPATIAAVSTCWERPIDHLELAGVITYDGTPDHEERQWLQAHGWCVREFRVTWDSAVALLQRGIPFTMVTTWVEAAHLQAVIGCDRRLGTFVIRDPYQPTHHEVLAVSFLKEQAPFGPRGMVFLPSEETHRLDGLDLPDVELYDEWFRLRRALVAHDRETAQSCADALTGRAPGHRLDWWARRALAYYDDDPASIHECVAALRKLHPLEANLRLEELAVLQRLGRRVEREALLREGATQRPPEPVFWRHLAEHLRSDARAHGQSRRLARRFVRSRPIDWAGLFTWANVLWDERAFPEAAQVYRLAATLGDKMEAPWLAYFNACRQLGKTGEALALLCARFRRLGAASSNPALTLHRCLEQADRSVESRNVLDEAIDLRPQDGELKLTAATAAARIGDFAAAKRLLEDARPSTVPTQWRRTAALLAAWRADHAEALGHWQEILTVNPLDPPALRETARLLGMTSGRARALAWLEIQVGRFPHFLPLRQIRLEWLRGGPPAEALGEVQAYLELHPINAWALREKALILVRMRRLDEALVAARSAEEIDPSDPQSPGVVGAVLLAQRQHAEAYEATARGLRLSVDAEWQMAQLLNAAPDFEGRKGAIKFLCQELARQPLVGRGFLQLQHLATGIVAADELAGLLRRLRESRSEHWQIWSASTSQALAMSRPEAAQRLAQEATRRFPLVPRVWLDLADVHRHGNNPDGETAALRRARELAPGWAPASRRLANLLQRTLRLDEAEPVLAGALVHDPLNAELHADRAEVLWQLKRPREAITAVERALELDPTLQRAWILLRFWSTALGDKERVINLARRVAARRAGEPAPHFRLACELLDSGQSAEALGEVESALMLAPDFIDLHDLRAVVLTRQGRYDEAKVACAPAIFGESIPTSLRGRAAWVEWQRTNHRGAVEAMQAVVKAQPDYRFGWHQLTEWFDALGDWREAIAAAEKLAAMEPRSVVPLIRVATLKIKAGEKREAIPFLERALRLEPTNRQASLYLLTLLCEFGRLDEAESVLSLVAQGGQSWHHLRCEIMLRQVRKERTEAAAAFRKLCRAPAEEAENLTGAAALLAEAGWQKDVEATLAEAVMDPGANAETGTLWVQMRLKAHRRLRLARLDQSTVTDQVRRRAWLVYLKWLGENRGRLRLSWVLRTRGAWLRADDRTWGEVSFVLGRQNRRRRLVVWMRDWRERRNVAPWMLYNLGHSLLKTRREAELPEVVEAAMKLPADHTRPMFVAWKAWLFALAGNTGAASRQLAVFDDRTKLGFAKVAAGQARALVGLAARLPDGPERAFRETRWELGKLATDFPATLRVGYMRRAQTRTLRYAAAIARRDFWRRWYSQPLANGGWRLPATIVFVLAMLTGIVVVAAGPQGDSGGAAWPALLLFGWLATAAFRSSRRRRARR